LPQVGTEAFVPFFSTATAFAAGDWRTAAQEAAFELGGIALGAATLGTGYYAVKTLKAYRAVRKAQKLATRGLTNPIPSRLARVIPGNVKPSTLGRPGSGDVFVTAADDIAGLNPAQIAGRLTIPNSKRFTVIEFNTPPGLASPINRTNPGFVGGGRTAGGAREFVLPNGSVPEDALIRAVGQ
jgi:hypothetical protein